MRHGSKKETCIVDSLYNRDGSQENKGGNAMRSLHLSMRVRLLLLGALLAPAAIPAAAQGDADIAKAVSLMQADNFSYQTTRSPSVWTIHFTGSHLKDIKVVVAVGGQADVNLVVFVTVTEKRRLPISTDFMRTLLEANHNLDRVKIGYDADGDLEVRVDAMLRVTDAAEFQAIVNQVKTSSDEIYGNIEPQLQP
jgi:hypothetical protein